MHNDPTQTAITLLLVSLIMTACGAPARPPVEVAEIEQRRLWSHTFADPPMVFELTDAGWIHAVTYVDADIELQGTRYVLDPDGTVVWEGPEETTVLLSTAPSVVVAAEDGAATVIEVYGLDGTPLWEFSLAFQPFGASRVGDTLLMFGTESGSPQIAAVDVVSGTPMWAVSPEGLPALEMGHFHLTLAGSTAWIVTADRVFAVELATGEIRWSALLPGETYAARLVPLDGLLLLQVAGSVVAFSDDGPVWQVEMVEGGSPFPMDVIATNRGALAAFLDQNQLYFGLLDSASGDILWSVIYPNNNEVLRGVAVGDDRVAFVSDETLIALDLATGNQAYTQPIGSLDGLGQVIPRGEHLVLAGNQRVLAYRLADGALLWSFEGFNDTLQWMDRRVASGAAMSAAVVGMALYLPDETLVREYYGRDEYGNSVVYEVYEVDWEGYYESVAATESLFLALASMANTHVAVSNLRWAPNHLTLNRILNTGITSYAEEVNAVAINLDTGQISEAGVTRSEAACATRLLIDPDGGRIYQAHHQFGLACTTENQIEAFRFDVR